MIMFLKKKNSNNNDERLAHSVPVWTSHANTNYTLPSLIHTYVGSFCLQDERGGEINKNSNIVIKNRTPPLLPPTPSSDRHTRMYLLPNPTESCTLRICNIRAIPVHAEVWRRNLCARLVG